METKIYVAASFAYEDKEKTNTRKNLIETTIERVKSKMKQQGLDLDNYSFYLPQQLKIPDAWNMSLEEWSRKVYLADLNRLEESDIVLFLSFGKENNSGSVWEVGYAFGQNSMWGFTRDDAPDKKKIICIKMTDEPESLMVTNSCKIIISEKDIETYDWVKMPDYKTKLEKLS